MTNLLQNMERIGRAIHAFRIPVSREDQTQAGIEKALNEKGITFTAQKILTAQERIDIYCNSGDFSAAPIGIEIKVKGSRPQIMRQLERYAALPDIHGLMLVTGVAWPFASGEIGGKPFMAIRIGQNWL